MLSIALALTPSSFIIFRRELLLSDLEMGEDFWVLEKKRESQTESKLEDLRAALSEARENSGVLSER